MSIQFLPTKKYGGCKVIVDENYRLYSKTIVDSVLASISMFDDHSAMMIADAIDTSSYQKKPREIDWVTLICGIKTLRSSIGYNYQHTETQFVMFSLEHALNQAIERLSLSHQSNLEFHEALTFLDGLTDLTGGDRFESRATYLYKLTSAERKKQLPFILKSINPLIDILKPELLCGGIFNDLTFEDLTTHSLEESKRFAL